MPIALLDLTLPGIAANLALDEALLDAAERGEGPAVLRLWELPGPAVVLGASGRIGEDVDVDACRADGVPIARRSSGGGTVVIGPGSLCVAVVLPLDHAPGLAAVDAAQHFVLSTIADSLRREGPAVEVLGSGDLTVDRRKISGSAQRRLRRSFMVHATILYDFPLPLIGRYTRPPRRQPDYRAGRPHEDFVANLPLPRDRVIAAVRAAWLPADEPATTAPVPLGRVEELVAAKFADPAWVERF